jgi:multidrug efflux system membrane fusion protein
MPEPEIKKKSGGHSAQKPIHLHPHPGKKRSKGPIIAIVFVAILLGVGILPRLHQANQLAETRHDIADVPESVNVLKPVVAPGNEHLELPSNLQAFETTTIYARTSGYLHQLFVDIGSKVKQGQVLATIESPEVDEQLSESRENVAKEKAAAQQADADIYRLKAGVESSVAQVSEAKSALEGANADVVFSKAKLAESKGALDVARSKLIQVNKKLDGVRASLAQYKTKEQLANKTYRRWKELAAGGAVSGQDLDETEAGYETSLSAVTEAEASVESAKADVVSAEAEVQSRMGDVKAASADVSSANQKVLAARSAVTASQSNVGAAQASVRAGQANESAANASIQASESSLGRVAVLRSFENVTAPFSGVITARNVDVGSLIGAGSGSGEGATDPQNTVTRNGMFGLAETKVLRAQVEVPQNYAEEIHVGDPAVVTTSQSSGLSVTGKVYDTAGALDATTRTLLVEVRVNNADGKLIPGMYATVTFQIHHVHAHLRIAADTLIMDSRGVRVAEVTPQSTVHFQDVTVGRDLGKEVEVLSGLDENAELIENPSDDLQEGQKVAVSKR